MICGSAFLVHASIRKPGKKRETNLEIEWRNALEGAVRFAIESGKNCRISVHDTRQQKIGNRIVLRRATNVAYRIGFVILPDIPIGTLVSKCR